MTKGFRLSESTNGWAAIATRALFAVGFSSWLAIATPASADVVWTLETTASVTGTISFNTVNSNYTPGGTASTANGAISGFEFVGGLSGSVWNDNDFQLGGLEVEFGATSVAPNMIAFIQYSDLDDIAPIGSGDALSFFGSDGTFELLSTADGSDQGASFRTEGVPEPVGFPFWMLGSCVVYAIHRRK